MGHIQATGIDDRGRKQYLYHRRWRERRDQQKFDEKVRFARCLPQLRRRVKRNLERDGFGQRRVLACAVRLLDRGSFRIGGEDYAESNDSYGLATMRKEHVTLAHVIRELKGLPRVSAEEQIERARAEGGAGDRRTSVRR